jgi:anaerobic ribonucleoside-triphosphate reductase|nr:MAG TPA: anaerobic ribonucleoside triphosphate reductase [Caudoviricetes sp.]
MIKYIEKRDGSIAKFNPKNIYNAVYQSAKSCNEFVDVDNVVRLVIERLEKRNQPTIHIEIVQDEVEFVLMGLGYFKAAKSYITYRNMRDAQRNLSLGNINAESSVEEYLSRADWRVNANANQGYSLGGMILNVAGKVTANYWLNKIYPKEIGQAHRNGDIHIHDLDMLSIYCCGWSLKNVLREGMNGIAGKIESNPPKHLSSALNQALNHLCCCFTGDTKIWKADGSTITFQECLDQDIKELDVLSFNEKTGKVVKSHMTDIGVYKEVDELIEFTFAFGDTIKCTPDHKFFTTKGWVEAKDLKFGNAIFTKIDRLKAYVRSTKRIKLDKKVPVFCGNVNDTHSFFTGDFGIASHNCQNEAAGAQAYSSFDTYMAPYIRLDNLSYKEVKQHLQEFIYNLNVPSRWGTQTPFTNLTFDWGCPEDLKKEKPVVGGKECDFFYGDLQKEMDMINKAYIEIMLEGDKNGRVFTFPIPTYNITPDFNWDSENSTLLFEMTAKYGLPYFQNFINSELKPNMIRSMCCRLQLDLRELLKRGNGLFGSAEQTGSIGVVTINCARLGYLFKGDKQSLYNRLDYLMDLARNSLELKRKTLKQNMDRGLYPYIKRWLGTLRNHFSTIGVNGINEMIRNFTNDKEDITTEKGHAFAVEFLDHVRAKLLSYQSEQGTMYNLEATPAEGTTYRFAKEDKKRFPDIIQAGTPSNPYYTNSSQLPVGYTDDPFEALELQDDLQRKYTGGTVLHLYMNEAISSSDACKKIVKKALTNFKLPYITITPTFSICPIHGYIKGQHEYCPKCDAELLAKKANK